MTDPVLLLKALADPTRLRLVRTLLEAPRYVEELAAALALSAPTVSHHLKKLEAAGVVSRRKDQYYVVYSVRREVLERTLVEVVAEGTETVGAEQQRLDAYRRRILETFIVDGRVRRMPAQRKKRLVVLDALAMDFARGRDYPEAEVDRIVSRRYDDYCTIRREMVDARILERRREDDRTLYRREEDTGLPPLPGVREGRDGDARPDVAERRRRLAQSRQVPRTAGVYVVRNRETGRVLLGSSLNLHGPLNRHRAELRFGSHRCRSLQDDWNRLGAEGFEFTVLETVDEALDRPERDAALRALEQDYLAHFQPFAERCYNGSEQIRTKPF